MRSIEMKMELEGGLLVSDGDRVELVVKHHKKWCDFLAFAANTSKRGWASFCLLFFVASTDKDRGNLFKFEKVCTVFKFEKSCTLVLYIEFLYMCLPFIFYSYVCRMF